MTRFGAVVPCRMDSTRLPGKALTPVRGRALLDYVLDRAARIPGLAGRVVATTARPVDAPILAHCARRGTATYTGPLEDVAARFLGCARANGFDAFLRLNGDSPFPDPDLWTEGMEAFEREGADLATNLEGRTFPYGISVEVVRTDAFEAACRAMETDEERQHVTRRLYARPEGLRIHRMTSAHPELREARLTVDTPEDLRTFARLAEVLADNVLTAGYAEVARARLSLQPREDRP